MAFLSLLSIIDLLHKNSQKEPLNSRISAVFPEEISNSSRPRFPEVVDTLSYLSTLHVDI